MQAPAPAARHRRRLARLGGQSGPGRSGPPSTSTETSGTNGVPRRFLLEEGDELVDVVLVTSEATEVVLREPRGAARTLPALGSAPDGPRHLRGHRRPVSPRRREPHASATDSRCCSPHHQPVTENAARPLITVGPDAERKGCGQESSRRPERLGRRRVLPTTDASEVLVTTQHGLTIRMAVKENGSRPPLELPGDRVWTTRRQVHNAVDPEPPIETNGAKCVR